MFTERRLKPKKIKEPEIRKPKFHAFLVSLPVCLVTQVVRGWGSAFAKKDSITNFDIETQAHQAEPVKIDILVRVSLLTVGYFSNKSRRHPC